jgi:uncharacterized RDD family membrane protein YckC
VNARILDGEIIASRLDDVSAYDGVRTRRVFAFLLGLLTFGLGWSLFAVLGPAVALVYVWNTLGGPNQATVGMRMMNIRLDRLDGRPVDGLLAVVHSVLFWAGNVVLTPLVLLVSLFADRKRTLHDLLLGTVVTRSDR